MSTIPDIASLVASVPPYADELDRFARQVSRRFATTTARVSGPTPAFTADDAARVVVWSFDDPLGAAELTAIAAAHLEQLRSAPVTVLDLHRDALGLDPLAQVTAALTAAGASVALTGFGPPPPGPEDRVVAIVAGDWYVAPAPAPPDFKVVAIMTAYNEADIVRPSIERLIAQGIDIYLLDNWSTDGTPDLVEDLVGHGLLAIERFPEGGRPEGYDWTGLLDRVAELAPTLDADWCVHHDVDQRRDSPWAGVPLRDALHTVQRSGWNAVDHTILEFRPTDDLFCDGTEVSEHLHHFELVPAARSAVHVQAWRNDQRVDLAATGGHSADFAGRRTYPFNFTLRHYPIRSQRHGDRKVFRDRKPRYAADELAKGWHYHYARMRDGHRFLRDPADLHRYVPGRFEDDFLLARVGQVGIPDREPGGANTAKAVARLGLERVGLLGPVLRLRNRSVDR